MTLHYHGTPITPLSAIMQCRGACFCVSFMAPQQIELSHRIGQSVMLDNGAYSAWRRNIAIDWDHYITWASPWLDYPTTWAVIPDSITGTEQENDLILSSRNWDRRQWAPVWHLHESIDRLLHLCTSWDKICFGSSGQYSEAGSRQWHIRITDAFNCLQEAGSKMPWIHMLRGMKFSGSIYPFASVDSTDVGRNHNRKHNPGEMVKDWDAMQCPGHWNRSLWK